MEYEISIDRVVEMFSVLTGNEDASSGSIFCRSAAAMVSDWLNPEKDLQSKDFQICYAAATTAFYRYCLQSVGGSTDIKAGDISVKDNSSERLSFAERLMHDALHDIEPICHPKRFAFITV